MKNYASRYTALEPHATNPWAERILGQLAFAVQLYENGAHQNTACLNAAFETLENALAAEGCIGAGAAQKAEAALLPLKNLSKTYTVLCAAHAHIDMDWMWSAAETVTITLDTFRTMLDLMNEFPLFKYSQSQASVYRIVEENDPGMLEEIRRRVQEGRWEVTASTWVETDKNMPCGESLARHILYTKRYMNKLFGLENDALKLDFEPDTFGHSENVPEILARGGVKYYYHCRGNGEEFIYNWQAPSGESVLVYREPLWYIASIDANLARYVPEFCHTHGGGVKTLLKVYGVGNHGGGPTRRDIRRLMNMREWPVYPNIEFGTFHQFFDTLAEYRERFPTVRRELNFTFSGCYTTQSRIKMANRVGERRLAQAEGVSAAAHTLAGLSYPAGRYRAAWEKVLYNQFHDILPGSCVQDSREDAMARFRQVLTVANTEAAGAMRAISQRVDTAFVPYVEDEQSRAEGAGVGYNAKNYIIPAAERGSGETRLFHVFNPSAFERQAVAELTVWDWCFEPKQATACLPDGTPLPCQLLDVQEDTALYSNPLYSNRGRFWGHKMFTLLVQVTVPALGYATVIIKKAPEEKISPMYSLAPRTEAPPPCVMENEYLRVTFAPGTPQLVSIIDMAGGKELLGKAEDGGFRLIQEETSARLNAWTVGQYMSNVPAGSNHRIVNRHLEPNAVRQYIDAQASFGDSTLQYRITLEKGSPALHFSVYVDWQEKPVRGESIPQLAYRLPLAYGCGGYKYDVPFGVVLREGMHQDLPGLSFACGVPANPDEAALCLVSETKYGFRCVENSLALALLRSAYNPDPYPELGEHCFGFSIRLTQGTNNLALLKGAEESTRGFNSLSVCAGRKGSLPTALSFAQVSGGTAMLSAVKNDEDGDGYTVLRLYETGGEDTTAVIDFCGPVKEALPVDINETRQPGAAPAWQGSRLQVPVGAGSVCTLKVRVAYP